MIEVSVIIPTWNRRNVLPRALKSVLRQEGVSFEILVIDDGSDDDTRTVVEQEFPSVSYEYQTNQGPAAARNHGLEKARGEWVAFLDSDDEWLPGKLKVQAEFFRQNPDYLICQTEEMWIRSERRVNPMKKHCKYGGRIFEKCLPLCLVSPSAVMIHRRIFEAVGSFDESYPACEDYELWLRIAARYPIGLIEKPYIKKYGGHEGQRSHAFPALDQFRIRALAKILHAGTLDAAQEKAAYRMLEKKTKIYAQGARKRDKQTAAVQSEELLDEVRNFLARSAQGLK